MSTNFKITAVANTFEHLFELKKEELQSIGAAKMIVDENPGYPCRVSLEDAEIGEEVILVPFQHHKTTSPYQSNGPIFVRKNAKNPSLGENEVPKMLLHRLLSLRVYNDNGMMIDAITLEGHKLEKEIALIFDNKTAHYIQIHNSSPGCYNCQVDRA